MCSTTRVQSIYTEIVNLNKTYVRTTFYSVRTDRDRTTRWLPSSATVPIQVFYKKRPFKLFLQNQEGTYTLPGSRTPFIGTGTDNPKQDITLIHFVYLSAQGREGSTEYRYRGGPLNSERFVSLIYISHLCVYIYIY